MFSVLLHGSLDKSNPHDTKALQDPDMVCSLSNEEDGAGASGIWGQPEVQIRSCLKKNFMKLKF